MTASSIQASRRPPNPSHNGPADFSSELDDQIRAALALNFSDACIQYKSKRAEALLQIPAGPPLESALSNHADLVDDDLPSQETYQARRQAFLQAYLRIPSTSLSTRWSETQREIDQALGVVQDLEAFQARFLPDFRSLVQARLSSLATRKYRILSRWNAFVSDSASVGRYGPGIRQELALIHGTFQESSDLARRLSRATALMMVPDAIGYVRDSVDHERLLETAEGFYLKLEWMHRHQLPVIESEIDRFLNEAESLESNTSMFLHRDDRSLDRELKSVLGQLGVADIDLSNAHRLVAELRSHINAIWRYIGTKTLPASGMSDAATTVADTCLTLRRSTWINAVRQCFMTAPSYNHVVNSRIVKGATASVDRVLLVESQTIEQQLDGAALEAGAANQARAAIDLLHQTNAAAAAANDATVLIDVPVFQKFQALFMARAALIARSEQRIVRRLNVLRSVQRRLVIDAVGGLAAADPFQLDRHRSGPETADAAHLDQARPRAFVVRDLDEFMRFDGIRPRDDSFERLPDEGDDEFGVRDADDVRIVYDAALDDWSTLKHDLLLMATYFLMKVDAAGADQHFGAEDGQQSSSSSMCDRQAILLQLYQCELDYQTAKCRLVFALLEAYDHAIDRDALQTIAQRIVEVIEQRPRVDLAQVYFRRRYEFDTRILRLEADLVRDVTQFQIGLQTPSNPIGNSDDVERRQLVPYGRRVALLQVCTSTATIATCIGSIRDCVARVRDIWTRTHPRSIHPASLSDQALELVSLSMMLDIWKEHAACARHPIYPRSSFMELLRCDPLWNKAGKMSELIEAIATANAPDRERRPDDIHRACLSLVRQFSGRCHLLRAQLESDLLASLSLDQTRSIVNGDNGDDGDDAILNIIGIRPGATIADSMGFPIEILHSICQKELLSESSSSAFLSAVALQKIFVAGLRFLVDYHGDLGSTNAFLSRYDASLFPSNRLLSHSTLLRLGELLSSLLERNRWKTSDLARQSRSKTDAYAEAISCQPDLLADCLKTGLQTNGCILDIVVACDRLTARVDSRLPPASSPFLSLATFRTDAKPQTVHWLFDLTRGVSLFRDVIVRGALPLDVSNEDLEREREIYSTLVRLCESAIDAQQLMVSSTAPVSTGFRISTGSEFVVSVLDDVRSNLFAFNADKKVAWTRPHTLVVVRHCVRHLHSTLRLFARNRADGAFSRFVDPDIRRAPEHLSWHLSIANRDAEDEIEVQLKRIFCRLSQAGSLEARATFADSLEQVVRLHDLLFALREYRPAERDASWVRAMERVLPIDASPEQRQAFYEIVKHTNAGVSLKARRPRVFCESDGGLSASDQSRRPVNITVPSDNLSSPIVLYLLSLDTDELDDIRKTLQSNTMLEMEALDLIEMRLKIDAGDDYVQGKQLPELSSLRDFLNGLSSRSTEHVIDSSSALNDPKQRRKDAWLISKSDLSLLLTRLGRSIVLRERSMLADLERTYNIAQNAFEHRLRLLENQKEKCEKELEETRKQAEWSINRGIIDSQFSTVLELERLKNRESRVKQRLDSMEKNIREQVEREFQREIASLKAQLLMKESRFVQYKSELRKQVSSGITDIRRQAMMGIVDSKRVPFQTKRQALQEIRDFTEESIAEQERVDMQRTMLRMKTLFEMKELTLHSRLESQVRKAQTKAEEANSLFEALEQLKQREKILLDQLIDEKNSVKISRDALHQLKQELEGCQKDRRNLLEWKAKNERQMSVLKADIEKYAELKSIDINALVSRLRKSEEALCRLASEKRPKDHSVLNKRIKQLEQMLASEMKAKADAITQAVCLKNHILELEQNLSVTNNQMASIATDLEKERRLNSDLIEETSGLQCLPVYPEQRSKRQFAADSCEERHDRPHSCFIKKKAAVPSLQVAAKHAVFTTRSRSSAQSRTGSRYDPGDAH